MKNVSFRNVDINGGFWKEKQTLVKDVTVYSVYDRFKETHRFDALKCDWKEGMPDKPHIFWDSDVAKWIEGVAYLLEKGSFPELKRIVDDAIDLIVKNADENGYFNSHFLVTRQDKRFCIRNDHELYCAGHLIEAAVAYIKAPGEERFLKAMCKYADYIEKCFKTEKTASFVTPGHPELELALVKLYELTGERRYFDLAQYFIDEHGKGHPGDQGTFLPSGNALYNQDEMPLKDRTTINGHSVRALYLYSGAADVARLRNDIELTDACKRMFDNTVTRRMYVTGGVGSSHMGEAFTVDFHLPNRKAYTETCAAISLVYFASRMQLLDTNSKYADCIERVIYNGMLSGISLSGDSFFYENPLEIDPEFNEVNTSQTYNERFAITQRKKVFDCSCCPPNLVRFIPSIADYMYTLDDDTLYVQQYMSSMGSFDGVSIEQKTDYPYSGKVFIRSDAGARRIAVRIPWWCKEFTLNVPYTIENGYAIIEAGTEKIELDLGMPINIIRSNRRIHSNAGRISVMRGPVVYCAEGVDNGKDIKNIRLSADADFVLGDTELGLPKLCTTAYQLKENDSLYSLAENDWESIPLTLIPYHAFANRGTTEMCVWLLEK